MGREKSYKLRKWKNVGTIKASLKETLNSKYQILIWELMWQFGILQNFLLHHISECFILYYFPFLLKKVESNNFKGNQKGCSYCGPYLNQIKNIWTHLLQFKSAFGSSVGTTFAIKNIRFCPTDINFLHLLNLEIL